MRGFIGPLGDDIPSIFPLVAGILLFISTVSYSVFFLQEKNQYLDVRKTALGLAYVATKSGATTVGQFNEDCSGTLRPYAGSRGVKFAVVLKKFCRQIDLSSYPFDDRTVISGSQFTGASCSTEGISASALANPANLPIDAVILNYPIAVFCPEEGSVTRGLGMVNVMVWTQTSKLEGTA